MKIKWKYCPFSIHDTDYLQFWLEDCSKQGLFLSGSGFVGPFARFYTASPKAMRYRVISALPKTSDDNQMVQMIHDSGWKSICSVGTADIYATTNSTAPEPHSDPDIERIDLKRMAVRKIIGLLLLFLIGPGSHILQLNSSIMTGSVSSYYLFDISCFILLLLAYIILIALTVYGWHIQNKHLTEYAELNYEERKKYGRNKNSFRFMVCTIIVILIVQSIIRAL